MNTKIVRFAATASLAIAAFAGLAASASPAYAAGDFDNDADVDGRDFLVWQRGSSPSAGGADLNDWRSNYGVGPSTAQYNPKELTVEQFVPWQK